MSTRCRPPRLHTRILLRLRHRHAYVSTYCHPHRRGDQCRLHCKICAEPCKCRCHGGNVEPYPGYDRAEEDRLRAAARRRARELGVPEGPRGVELISDIATSAVAALRRDGGEPR